MDYEKSVALKADIGVARGRIFSVGVIVAAAAETVRSSL